MKCSQTGKLHTVKLRDLSREDCEPLTKSDLTKGSDLMMKMKGKLYPVKFAQFKDNNKSSNGRSKEKASEKAAKKRHLVDEEEEDGKLRDKTNVSEILAKAKVRFSVSCPGVHTSHATSIQ